MSQWTDDYSYWAGVQIDPTLGVFLLGDDEMIKDDVPYTVVATLRKTEWDGEGYKWLGTAVCWATKPRTELIVVGTEGEILAGPLDKLAEEQAIEIEREDDKSGFLTCAKAIGGRVYIGGMDRQVYRRTGKSAWEAVDQGLPYDSKRVVGFQAIDGFSEKEIYAVGRLGEIWRYDGKKWHAVSSPTNLILLGVHCAEDGLVYACGQVGTLLRGRGNEWEVVKHKATKEDFWDVTQFKGVVYVMTRKILFQLKGNRLTKVDFGDTEIPFSFYRFTQSKSEMWTIGSKDVMRFDGDEWTRIE
jgi:hypothetical protein